MYVIRIYDSGPESGPLPSPCASSDIHEQLLREIVKRFRGGLVFKMHRLVYHSTLGS